MEAKDLMIEDWVYDTILQGYTRVKVLTARGIQGDIHDNIWDEKTFEPIPLTPEILEKNGFDVSDPEVKQYHFEEDGQRYHFSLRQMYNQKDGKPNGYSFFAFGVLTIIDYVHQLQHALRLCGIDKEIEL